MRIGLISDTHSFFHPDIPKYFKDCDEIWHAGDVGNIDVIKNLEHIAPVKGVYGNIDGPPVRGLFPEDLRFDADGLDVWITHIGGYPGKYNQRIRNLIKTNPPDLFICGHSHILKVMWDKELNVLHINPGAAGKEGFHRVQTLIRFSIIEAKPQDLEIIELGKK